MAHLLQSLSVWRSFSGLFFVLLWGSCSSSSSVVRQSGHWLPGRALSSLPPLRRRILHPSSITKMLQSRKMAIFEPNDKPNANPAPGGNVLLLEKRAGVNAKDLSTKETKKTNEKKTSAVHINTTHTPGQVPACLGAPKGVYSVLPSNLNLTTKAGIVCSPPKNPPGKLVTPASAGPMLAANCVCAFNLIQQSLFKKSRIPLIQKQPNTTKSTNPGVYNWEKGDLFSAACGAPLTETVQECDKKKPLKPGSSGCAKLTEKGACGTVNSCTVNITVTGKSTIDSVPVQNALTDPHYGLLSYAYSCCQLQGFVVSINDFPNAEKSTDTYVVTGASSKTSECT